MSSSSTRLRLMDISTRTVWLHKVTYTGVMAVAKLWYLRTRRVCFNNLFTICIYRPPSVQIYNLHPPSTSLSSNDSSLQKTNGNITLDPRGKMYLNIQIQLNFDFQARISILLLLAILSWSSLRGATLAQLTARVLVEWVATRRQRFLCDIGCVLSTVGFWHQS